MATPTSPLRSRARAAPSVLRPLSPAHRREADCDNGLGPGMSRQNEVLLGSYGIPGWTARMWLASACNRPTRRSAQRGQAMTEYIVVVGFLLVLLWVGANTSTVQQLVTALKSFWTDYSYLISLP